MERLFRTIESVAPRLLRYSLAVVLLWIGGLKFADPSPVVGLLGASLPFLAFPGFVYVLGVFEVVAAGMLILNWGVRYAGLGIAGLFTGTILIFLIAPAVSYGEAGFPMLTLAGEFLLKDLVLFSAALVLVATAEGGKPAAA